MPTPPRGPFAWTGRPVRGLGALLVVALLVLCCGGPSVLVSRFLRRFGHAQEYMTGFRASAERPLTNAAMLGDLRTVESLLDGGADAGETDEQGRTPLHWAAYANQKRVVEALLAHGADPDPADANGQTPLHLAALSGHDEVVGMLLEAGAEAARADLHGQTALDLARASGQRAVARMLEANG